MLRSMPGEELRKARKTHLGAWLCASPLRASDPNSLPALDALAGTWWGVSVLTCSPPAHLTEQAFSVSELTQQHGSKSLSPGSVSAVLQRSLCTRM